MKNLALIRVKGLTLAALLFILAFAVPTTDSAQDNPVGAGPSRDGSAAKAAETSGPGAITDIKIDPDADKLTVTVMTDRLIAPQDFFVDDPARLVLDFPNTRNKVSFTRLAVNKDAVKRVRVQQFQDIPSPIARVVFDLGETHGKHRITSDASSVRIVFDADDPKAAPVVKSAVATPTPAPAVKSAVSQPAPTPAVKSAVAPTAPTAPEVKPTPVAAKPSPPPVVKPKPAVVQETPKPAPPAQETLPTVRMAKADDFSNPRPLPLEPAQKNPAPPAPVVKPAVASSPSRFSGQPLTLDLVEIPLIDFFRLMAEEGGINIVLDPDVKGKISIKGEKMPWDQIFEMALVTNGLDKQIEGNLIRVTRKATLQEEAQQREALKKANLLAADLETRIRRLNYAKADSLSEILADQKTARGTVVVDERTNALILTDIPESIGRMMQLIDTLDTPQPQVEIEARVVSATRDFARDIGIQFGFVDGNLQRVTVGGPNTFGTIGGTRPSATPTSTFVAGNPATGRGAASDDATESAAVSTGTSSQNAGNYNVNLPATKAFGGVGISIGNIFDTFLLDAAITAGESKGLAKLISQPKVTAQNNSPAVITQGLRFPVQIIANNTISVQFQNAALTLTVTPQITYEGNIVLDLKVENNTPDFGRHVNGIPSIRTSESTTRVLVTDGGTTVIGGILIDQESDAQDKVPGLGSLPVIGNLFRRTAVSRSTQEVLFFVTPRIIK